LYRGAFHGDPLYNQAQSDPHDNPPRDLVGKVAVTTHFMTVRFGYLWVVIPRP